MIDIEKLADGVLEKIHPYDNWVGSINDLEQFAEAYTAEKQREQEHDKRVMELTATIAELKEHNLELQFQNNLFMQADVGLKAHINVLRVALEYYADNNVGTHPAKRALALTPAQCINDDMLIFDKKSLIQHDNEVIEKCAKVCDNYFERVVAEHVRALKGEHDVTQGD